MGDELKTGFKNADDQNDVAIDECENWTVSVGCEDDDFIISQNGRGPRPCDGWLTSITVSRQGAERLIAYLRDALGSSR